MPLDNLSSDPEHSSLKLVISGDTKGIDQAQKKTSQTIDNIEDKVERSADKIQKANQKIAKSYDDASKKTKNLAKETSNAKKEISSYIMKADISTASPSRRARSGIASQSRQAESKRFRDAINIAHQVIGSTQGQEEKATINGIIDALEGRASRGSKRVGSRTHDTLRERRRRDAISKTRTKKISPDSVEDALSVLSSGTINEEEIVRAAKKVKDGVVLKETQGSRRTPGRPIRKGAGKYRRGEPEGIKVHTVIDKSQREDRRVITNIDKKRVRNYKYDNSNRYDLREIDQKRFDFSTQDRRKYDKRRQLFKKYDMREQDLRKYTAKYDLSEHDKRKHIVNYIYKEAKEQSRSRRGRRGLFGRIFGGGGLFSHKGNFINMNKSDNYSGITMGGMGSMSTGMIAGGLGGYAGVKGIAGLIGLADEMKTVESRIKYLTEGSKEYDQTLKNLIKTSKQTGANISDVTSLFQGLSTVRADLGATNQEISRFTDTVAKIRILGGTNKASSDGAMIQLRQALTNGVVRGQEYKSIADGLPEIPRLIADKMGITQGELRLKMLDGDLMAKDVFDIILDSAEEVDKNFKTISKRIHQSFGGLATSAKVFAGGLDKNIKATDKVAKSLDYLSEKLSTINVDALGNAIKDSASALKDLAIGVGIMLTYTGIGRLAAFSRSTKGAKTILGMSEKVVKTNPLGGKAVPLSKQMKNYAKDSIPFMGGKSKPPLGGKPAPMSKIFKEYTSRIVNNKKFIQRSGMAGFGLAGIGLYYKNKEDREQEEMMAIQEAMQQEKRNQFKKERGAVFQQLFGQNYLSQNAMPSNLQGLFSPVISKRYKGGNNLNNPLASVSRESMQRRFRGKPEEKRAISGYNSIYDIAYPEEMRHKKELEENIRKWQEAWNFGLIGSEDEYNEGLKRIKAHSKESKKKGDPLLSIRKMLMSPSERMAHDESTVIKDIQGVSPKDQASLIKKTRGYFKDQRSDAFHQLGSSFMSPRQKIDEQEQAFLKQLAELQSFAPSQDAYGKTKDQGLRYFNKQREQLKKQDPYYQLKDSFMTDSDKIEKFKKEGMEIITSFRDMELEGLKEGSEQRLALIAETNQAIEDIERKALEERYKLFDSYLLKTASGMFKDAADSVFGGKTGKFVGGLLDIGTKYVDTKLSGGGKITSSGLSINQALKSPTASKPSLSMSVVNNAGVNVSVQEGGDNGEDYSLLIDMVDGGLAQKVANGTSLTGRMMKSIGASR